MTLRDRRILAKLSAVEQRAESAHNLVLRNNPVRIATFGDSTANVGVTSSPDKQDTSFITAPFPATGQTTVIGLTGNRWMTSAFYPQAYLVGNCGITGETTTTMLARDGAAASTTRKAIQDCLDLNPDVIFFRGASINDLTTATPANWRATADAAFVRHKTILRRMLTGGAIVFDQGIYGYGDGASANATYPEVVRTALKYLNSLISAHCATLPGRLYYLDPVTARIQDASGKYVALATTDGVHPNSHGQILGARMEVEKLTEVFGRSGDIRYRGTNVVENYLFHNTGAVGQGVAATGITYSYTNATAGNAQVEEIGNKTYQTCEFAFTGTSNSASVKMTAPIATAGITANDVWGFEYDFFVIPVSGITTIAATALTGRVDLIKTGAGRVVNERQMGAFTLPLEGLTGKMVFPPFKIQEASASITQNAYSLTLTTNHISGTVKIGVANPRMVKLGTAQVTE